MLEDVTFIIPLKIESPDRERNVKLCLNYLTYFFDSNIIIALDKEDSNFFDYLKNFKLNNKIKNKISCFVFQTGSTNSFHRTSLLNSMLKHVETPIVVNYDCDVVLPISSYIEATKLIKEEGYDLVYPFGNKQDSQRRVEIGNLKDTFIQTGFSLEFLETLSFDWPAAYGFCQVFKTKSYKDGGGENEEFIAYGPEDVERFERWTRMNQKVGRIDDLVYHFEHSRTPDSSPLNVYMKQNEILLEKIRKLDNKQFNEYIESLQKTLTQDSFLTYSMVLI